MSKEIWRKCIAPYTRYEVSNMGRVRNAKGEIMKPKLDHSGYFSIGLSWKGKPLYFRVHRLVGMAFCDGWKEGMQIDHINRDAKDNRAENLRWVTPKQNCSNRKTNDYGVVMYKPHEWSTMEIYNNFAEIARKYGGRPRSHFKYGIKFRGFILRKISREQYLEIKQMMNRGYTLERAYIDVMTKIRFDDET